MVASVDGDPITVHDLKTFAAVNKVTLPDPDDVNSPDTKAVLKGVISERLLESEVKKYKDQVDDRQIDEYIANFEQSNGLTDAQLRAQLQSQGHTYEEFRKHARMELQKMIMIQKEVRGEGQHLARRGQGLLRRASAGVQRRQGKLQARANPDRAAAQSPRPTQVEAARVKADSIRKQLARWRRFRQAGAPVLRRRFQKPGRRAGRFLAR